MEDSRADPGEVDDAGDPGESARCCDRSSKSEAGERSVALEQQLRSLISTINTSRLPPFASVTSASVDRKVRLDEGLECLAYVSRQAQVWRVKKCTRAGLRWQGDIISTV